jgi:hypothetical protein
MLKITRNHDGETGLLLRLEGKLVGPWVQELAGVCPQAGRPCHVRLDLSAVTFVDESGERMLRTLIDRGVTIAAVSGFVAALLRLEDR